MQIPNLLKYLANGVVVHGLWHREGGCPPNVLRMGCGRWLGGDQSVAMGLEEAEKARVND